MKLDIFFVKIRHYFFVKHDVFAGEANEKIIAMFFIRLIMILKQV